MATTNPTTEPRLTQHPCSAALPAIPEADFNALLSDIKQNGQQLPILVYDDQVLDGWHRYRACRELGIEPKLEEFTGDDPVSTVISLNLKRRHLGDDGQRAMIAAQLATLGRGRPSKEGPPSGGITTAAAAALVNAKRRTVERAKVVALHGTPELVDLVKNGKVSLAAAERRVRSRDAAPPKPAAPRRRSFKSRLSLDQRVENAIEFINNGIESLGMFLTDEPHTSSQAATWRPLMRRTRRALEKIERRLASRRTKRLTEQTRKTATGA